MKKLIRYTFFKIKNIDVLGVGFTKLGYTTTSRPNRRRTLCQNWNKHIILRCFILFPP